MSIGDTLFLFLPADQEAPLAWLRATDGAVTTRGIAWQEEPDARSGARVIGIVPASHCGFARIDLPALAPAQAAAAARLALADRIGLTEGEAQVSVEPGTGDRRMAWASSAWVRGWLDRLAALGLAPDALIPASVLVRPEPGQCMRLALPGETLCVAREAAWPDDGLLTPAMGLPVVDLAKEDLEAALLAAAADPAINLLAGQFAPRRSWLEPLALWKQVAGMTAALLLLIMLVPVARAWMAHRAASALELQALERARRIDPAARDPQAVAAFGQRRFSDGYARLAAAISETMGAELASLSQTRGAPLSASVRVADAAMRDALIARLNDHGLGAQRSAESVEQGRLLVVLTLEGR